MVEVQVNGMRELVGCFFSFIPAEKNGRRRQRK
jgi:hypothetical protein